MPHFWTRIPTPLQMTATNKRSHAPDMAPGTACMTPATPTTCGTKQLICRMGGPQTGVPPTHGGVAVGSQAVAVACHASTQHANILCAFAAGGTHRTALRSARWEMKGLQGLPLMYGPQSGQAPCGYTTLAALGTPGAGGREMAA